MKAVRVTFICTIAIGVLAGSTAGVAARDGSAFEPSLGVGASQQRGDATVTLKKVVWAYLPPKVGPIFVPGCRWYSRCFPKGMKSVAILVRYECGQRREKPKPRDWKAYDKDGFSYHIANWQKSPTLSGVCKPGGSTRGWATFYVPKGADWLRFVEKPLGPDALSWTVQRKKGS